MTGVVVTFTVASELERRYFLDFISLSSPLVTNPSPPTPDPSVAQNNKGNRSRLEIKASTCCTNAKITDKHAKGKNYIFTEGKQMNFFPSTFKQF